MASGEHGTKPSPGHAATPSSEHEMAPSPSEHRAAPSAAAWMLASSWQSTLVVGVLTLILGIFDGLFPVAAQLIVIRLVEPLPSMKE